MIIFLYGKDTYRSSKKLEEIIEKYKKVHQTGLNLKFIDAKKLSFQEFSDQLKINSMFDEKKLIVLKELFLSNNFREKFINKISDFKKSDNIIVIQARQKIDKRKKAFKSLKKYSKSQEFKILEDYDLENWAKRQFSRYQAKINPRALKTLVEYTGSDLWRLSNEIKKLVSYKNFLPNNQNNFSQKNQLPKKEIEIKDVKLLVRPEIKTDIFETIDALAQKNKKRALQKITNHLEDGDSPLYLLAMINYQFRNLMMIKDLIEKNQPYYSIQKKTSLHPFVVKKTYGLAKKFNLFEIKKIYQDIFKVDLDIKTGRIEPRTGLEMLISRI